MQKKKKKNLYFSDFSLCSCLTLFDYKQVDSFATSRDSETHEATRRILSVILRQVTFLSLMG